MKKMFSQLKFQIANLQAQYRLMDIVLLALPIVIAVASGAPGGKSRNP